MWPPSGTSNNGQPQADRRVRLARQGEADRSAGSPLSLLAEARVVAIPSDLGMGFKTKILEAILAGCWVLVTEDVQRRLPDAVRLGAAW